MHLKEQELRRVRHCATSATAVNILSVLATTKSDFPVLSNVIREAMEIDRMKNSAGFCL
jgi:hypothetical protein